VFSGYGFAQDGAIKKEKYTAHNKGKFFLNYGGNRDYFTKSDIEFSGPGYHFTLNDVDAHDKPKGIHADYINPGKMTIPQTNFRLGYYFNDKYSISLGVDHMKYVMTQFQTVNMTGTISGHPPYDGTYNNTPMEMTTEFLKFEHTNGLNYVNAELTRLDDVGKYAGLVNENLQVNTVAGAGIGFLYPKTDVTLMGEHRHNEFHVAGYGANIKGGLNVTFLKYFFIQSEANVGYINMPDIRTTDSKDDKAKQHFYFLQTNFVVGGIFRIF
jgi:hypothetical protein